MSTGATAVAPAPVAGATAARGPGRPAGAAKDPDAPKAVRIKYDWAETPFAVFSRKGTKPVAVAKSVDELKQILSTLGPTKTVGLYAVKMNEVKGVYTANIPTL